MKSDADVRIRSSLEPHVGEPAMGESELRALAARAHRLGVIVFLRVDLARLPWAERGIIEGAAKRLYGGSSW